MNIKVAISFTEPENEEEQKEKVTDILSDGLYAYLKKSGHLKKDRSLTHKVERVLAQSRKICQGFDEIDSA